MSEFSGLLFQCVADFFSPRNGECEINNTLGDRLCGHVRSFVVWARTWMKLLEIRQILEFLFSKNKNGFHPSSCPTP